MNASPRRDFDGSALKTRTAPKMDTNPNLLQTSSHVRHVVDEALNRPYRLHRAMMVGYSYGSEGGSVVRGCQFPSGEERAVFVIGYCSAIAFRSKMMPPPMSWLARHPSHLVRRPYTSPRP